MLVNRYFSVLAVTALCALNGVSAWGQRSCKVPGTTFVGPGRIVFPVEVPPGTNPGKEAGPLITSTFSITTTAGTTTGTMVSAVYDNGGTLDFYYQVSNDAASAFPLVAVEATSFAGYKPCVGFRTDGSILAGFQNGSTSPVTATSSTAPPAGGYEIGFQFYPPTAPPAEIAPGMTSQVLVISTNATQSNAMGAAIVLDQAAGATVSAYQPVMLWAR